MRDRAASLVLTNPADAYRVSQDLLESLRATPDADARTRAVVWRCRGETAAYTGRFKEAREAYERSATAARSAGDENLLGQILVGSLGVLSIMGDGPAAARLFPEAERLLRRTGDQEYLGKLYMNAGNASYHEEDYRRAARLYGRAAEAFARTGTRDATWVGLVTNQAVASTQLGRIAEARRIFLEAEEDCRRRDVPDLEARVQFNRAFVERLRGDFREALILLEASGAVFESHGERDMVAATHRARAEIYLELGMGREALDLSRSSAAAFAAEGMVVDEKLGRLDEARALVLTGRPGEASGVLEALEAHYAERRTRPRLAAVRLLLARARFSQGRPGESRRLIRQALRVFQSLGMTRHASEARRLLARVHLSRGRPQRAEQALRPAYRDARRLPLGERAAVLALAGAISLARNRRDEARRRLWRAVDAVEAQRRVIPGLEFRARAFERHVAVYHELIRLHLGAGRPRVRSVFHLVEAARARLFRERTRQRAPGTNRGLAEARARLGSLVHRLEEAEASGNPDLPGARRLRSEVQRLESEIQDRVRRGQAREPGAAGWWPVRDVREIPGRLAPDEALLEYFVTGETVLAFAVTRRGTSMIELPASATEIGDAVERMHLQLETMALCADTLAGSLPFLRSSAESVLAELHAALMEPVLHTLPAAGRLYIVPHAVLHQVPFESLTDGRRHVDESWTVVRAPTADSLVGPRRGRRPKRNPAPKVLVAGSPEHGPAFVEREMEAVASLYPKRDVEVLRDPPADRLLEEIARFDVVHLVTHAVFRGDNPAFSRLATKRGALFVADILEARLRADLVVLSACNTGRVFTGRGDDLSGVAHAFLAAGARQLVASHWRVHDAATREVMEEFHRHYRRAGCGDPGRALRAAGRRVRERREHPFFWGGFSVHGGLLGGRYDRPSPTE